MNEKGKWKAYNVSAIVNNVNVVFKNQDIEQLNKKTYEFIINHMGFIAHYDLGGFQGVYEDLRKFAARLQTSEYDLHDKDRNLKQAARQETDHDFREWYGEAYNKSIASTIRGIIAVVREHESKTAALFDKKQKDEELRVASSLAEKHGYKLVPRG
jgi:hypothetical protein